MKLDFSIVETGFLRRIGRPGDSPEHRVPSGVSSDALLLPIAAIVEAGGAGGAGADTIFPFLLSFPARISCTIKNPGPRSPLFIFFRSERFILNVFKIKHTFLFKKGKTAD